ncbi:isoprenyl transferase [Schnuerera sp. xch1]|uniref:isoprenyl transferase n=1 Tax=Schnuerera sp. xch1 TaxID=2874283 RepID=UPI001CBBA97A|nr:isoprenyl transferase [Schnuerera sp. xch1]MBZ2173841.1 isoprenyl transferase [Schnuerera sp. xch1]
MNTDKILQLKKKIDLNRIPKHVAIIMDGNGRWAKERFLPRTSGHQEGVKRVVDIVEVATKLNIKYLSLYAFSTENWKRPKNEIESLMKLLVQYLREKLDKIYKNNIKIQTMGDLSKLPIIVRKEVEKAIKKTINNSGMVLNIALNYGGRDEIICGIKKILEDVRLGKLKEEDIDGEMFSNYLYTQNMPDPDLLIRPSGELRLSNFMLYQVAYTEFWFSDVYWPDFKEEHLYEAIIDYQKRKRRFGGI